MSAKKLDVVFLDGFATEIEVEQGTTWSQAKVIASANRMVSGGATHSELTVDDAASNAKRREREGSSHG